jgi:transcriptional regulator with XRE-family HTH domain
MTKVHIGKKIKEVLDKNPMTAVEFAEKIGLTRNGAYKVFEKETIDTGQLQKIGKVLGHDFFLYYREEEKLSPVKESTKDYGFANQHEVNELKQIVKDLAKEVSKLREEIAPNLPTGKAGKKVATVTYKGTRAKKK